MRDRSLLTDTVVVVTADHGEHFDEGHPVRPLGGHMGEPSYQEVLRVPLVVWPARGTALPALVRGQDTFDLLRAIAGAPPLPARDLEPDEHFVGEQRYVVYRRGRWKSVTPRAGGPAVLFDLERDPGETEDVAAGHPDVVAAHAARVATLARALAGTDDGSPTPDRDAEERLRVLGYVE